MPLPRKAEAVNNITFQTDNTHQSTKPLNNPLYIFISQLFKSHILSPPKWTLSLVAGRARALSTIQPMMTQKQPLLLTTFIPFHTKQHSQANHSKMRQTPGAHPSHQYPSLHCTTFQPRPPPAVLAHISAVLLGMNPIGILMTCSIAGIRNRSIVLTDWSDPTCWVGTGNNLPVGFPERDALISTYAFMYLEEKKYFVVFPVFCGCSYSGCRFPVCSGCGLPWRSTFLVDFFRLLFCLVALLGGCRFTWVLFWLCLFLVLAFSVWMYLL